MVNDGNLHNDAENFILCTLCILCILLHSKKPFNFSFHLNMAVTCRCPGNSCEGREATVLNLVKIILFDVIPSIIWTARRKDLFKRAKKADSPSRGAAYRCFWHLYDLRLLHCQTKKLLI